MSGLKNFGRFCYDFVIGDDWTIAIGVLASIAATSLLASHLHLAWLIIPIAVTALLAFSLGRAQRAAWAVETGELSEP
jgi:hypothetical protein